ncbi:MAG: stage V sporulation protein T [Oscillospiraceae bacterium]|nr:stage V sporulation protein T [Oscillospiraceae bacterium]
MKATGIVRRIDDLGRVVIPKEIRRTMRLRDGDLSLKSMTQEFVFCMGLEAAKERCICK